MSKLIIIAVTLIIEKRRTIDEVPTSIREQVIADLAALGYDENGDPIQHP